MPSVDRRRGTHEVTNQTPPLEDYNLFEQDPALVEAVDREGGGWGLEGLTSFGATIGGRPLRLGVEADRNPPRLRSHDRFGHRVDEVEVHPAWTELLHLGIRAGIPSVPWRRPGPGAHVVRGAHLMLLSQAEAGVGCPLSMTFAAVPALRRAPDLAAVWEPRLLDPDPASSALCGMAMTEKQGGSDVRANTTRAEPAGDGAFELLGHKWFCSHPSSDVFLTLAQAPGGLTCFLLPRRLPGGAPNGFLIQRLKDKLGTRALASAEIELDHALAWPVGEEGRGVQAIIEMVNHTRLDCVLGSAALMRRAVAEACHHVAHRSAFGAPLVEQPLMANVVADLCVESEAATLLAVRLARAYDEEDAAFRRVSTAVAKYWVCKRAVPVAAEALECLGGNGYVEESPMPRLLRDSPLNSIWEGSGNVIALDVLRALTREAETLPALLAEVEPARGSDGRLDRWLDRCVEELAGLGEASASRGQHAARRLVEDLALLLQGSLVVRHSPAPVAEAFLSARLGGDGGRTFGTLPPGVDAPAIIDRHRPRLEP